MTRIAIIEANKCKPDKCAKECIKKCPPQKTGKQVIDIEVITRSNPDPIETNMITKLTDRKKNC